MMNFLKIQKFQNIKNIFNIYKGNSYASRTFTNGFRCFSNSNSSNNSSNKSTLFSISPEKYQNKFVKLSTSNNLDSKFPKEEENIDNLLNDLQSVPDILKSDINFIQKGNILFLGGKSQNNSKFNLKNIKLGDFISINNSGKELSAQCIAIRETMFTFFLVNNEQLTSPIGEISMINKKELSSHQSENIFGKVVDLKDQSLISYLVNSNVTPSLTKSRKRRKLVDDTVLTGNLLVDYISPIYKGNFNILSGGANLGQKQMLNLIALNFLDKNKYVKSSGKNKQIVVYITHSKKEAFKVSQLLSMQNEKNGLKNDNFVIFTASDHPSDTEYYYLPRVALNFIRNLVSTSGFSMDVLVAHDDMANYILQEKNIFQNAKCNISSTNIFAEIREDCGIFPGNYSLTSVLISEKNKINSEFEEDYIKTLSNISSFTDKIINFEPNIKMLKKHLPNLQIDFSGIANIKIQSGYVLAHLLEFKEILKLIHQSHTKEEEIKKLNIQSDPWDNYLYHDSKFFLDFIFYKNLKNVGKNLNNSSIPVENPEMNFILLKFLLFIFHNDFLANFRIDGKTVALKLIEFLNQVQKDDEAREYINKFLEQVLITKVEPTSEEIDKFETKFEIFFDLFLQELSAKKEFSDLKEDYFKI